MAAKKKKKKKKHQEKEPQKERLLPLLFHRRLVLLACAAAVSSTALGVQLVNLTLLQGAERRAVAESRLDIRSYLPTTRGSILDRHGEILAYDRASYDIAVDYRVISGVWVIEQCEKAARAATGSHWFEMSPAQRAVAMEGERPFHEFQAERLWDIICARGGIDRAELDRRLDEIRTRVERTASEVWSRQEAEAHAKYGKPRPGEKDPFERRPIREHEMPHPILRNVPQALAFDFQRFAEDLPGLSVLDSTRREYPWSSATVILDRSKLPLPVRTDEPIEIEVLGVADHIIGDMRHQVWASDIERREFRDRRTADDPIDLGGYSVRFMDAVGHRGSEAIYEDHLRGYRGVLDNHLNTGEVDRVEPEPGKDLELAIDIHLQAKIQAVLSPEFGLTVVQPYHAGVEPQSGEFRNTALPPGTELNSAAVVIDVDTGEILALVSMPTIAEGESWPEWRRKLANHYLNRAAASPYPPGSIIKPLVLVSAVTEGVHNLDRRIACTGHYFPHWKDNARCWIYRPDYGMRTHTDRLGGPLAAPDALAASCNIYFYTLADELGAARLMRWYERFGIGRLLNAGLARQEVLKDEKGREHEVVFGEHPGEHPSMEDLARLTRSGQLQFNEVIMGIGQGPLTWTPLHAANAYATIARAGALRDATILKDDPRPRGAEGLHLDPRAVHEALEGLRQAVMESHGTGHVIQCPDGQSEPIINAERVTVWAKTGTAQAPPMKIDHDQDGEPDGSIDELDHAWFVGLVGSGGATTARPQYAIAVLVEYGGSGGRVAGPIANQIILALQDEGYLE